MVVWCLTKNLKHIKINTRTAKALISYEIRAFFNLRCRETGIDPTFYANRERALDEIMPYDHISCCVTKEFLLEELAQAKKAATTDDCRQGCNGCGLERWCSKR